MCNMQEHAQSLCFPLLICFSRMPFTALHWLCSAALSATEVLG